MKDPFVLVLRVTSRVRSLHTYIVFGETKVMAHIRVESMELWEVDAS